MLTLQDAHDFFAEHLSNESFSKFPAEKQLAAIRTAANDIAAAAGIPELPDNLPVNLRNAVFEQAIFLLLNPHLITGSTGSDPLLALSPRAKAWLPPAPAVCPLLRG